MKQLGIILLLFGLLTTGCKQRNIDAYAEYISGQDNGLQAVQSNNGLTVRAQYLPVEYQVLKQIKKGLAEEEIDQALEGMKGHHYFKLSLESPLTLKRIAERKGQSWNDVVLQLQYHSKTRFKIKKGSTDFPCVLYHAISGINPSSKMELMLVFTDDSPGGIDEDLVLEFEDDLFTGTTYELIIKKEAINSIPKVELL